MATVNKGKRSEEKIPEPDQQIVNPFSDPTSDSDLILLVEEQRLHVNKVVLSLASPVFKRMFEADFKEKSTKEISLPDKKFANMLEFLLCIYPSTYKPVTRENLDAVLPLAHEYQVKQLVGRCEDFVLIQFQMHDEKLRDPPLEELVHFLFLADRYDLNGLLRRCIEKMKTRNYTCSNYEKRFAENKEEFKMVSLKTKYEILLKRMQLLEPMARNLSARDDSIKHFHERCFAYDKFTL